MKKQQIIQLYNINTLNNFNYIYSSSIISIKFIFNFNIFNFSLSKNIFTYYFNYIYFKSRLKKNKVKTRSEINKSTKKPWPQKKLGKARAGSFKSPLWRGGGVIFGPVNKNNIKFKLNKRLKKICMVYYLLSKRTMLYYIYMYSIFHSFNTLKSYMEQQLRTQGIFFNKILYVTIYDINLKMFDIISITKCNIQHLLNSNYIIFLI